MRSTILIRAITLVAALGLAACESNSTTELDSDSLVATWDVRSIDGQTLPITESEDVGDGVICTYTFSSGAITFAESGRFTTVFNGSAGCTGTPTQNFNETSGGTWRVQGSTLYMKQDADEDGQHAEEPHTFTRSGNTLTVTNIEDNSTIILQRR